MIEFLDQTLFINKIEKLNEKYWNNSYKTRWNYMSKVIDELKNIDINRSLEIGAYKINLINISDNMDLNIKNIDPDNINNINYIQDATKLPWNIKDKYYDIVIALQVFEHLNDKQSEIFKEITRISKNIILSFPYKWQDKNDIIHYNLDENIFNKWTNNIKPNKKIIIENRMIYIYNFKND